MRAALYKEFKGAIGVERVPDPGIKPHGVLVKVMASGLCRSDWHGWMGHDPDIMLPHVPGHEWVGEIADIGAEVRNFMPGDRVTAPFVCGCGSCGECKSGNHQVCDYQSQPGFTHWGSFAEFVAVDYADTNLVKIPEAIDNTSAAALGCRFITAYRAVVAKGKVGPGTFVAIHGCGGVGLSAVMIANALGASVIGVDVNEEALALAGKLGAQHLINAGKNPDVVEHIRTVTNGGVHVSLDALGSRETCANSIAGLRKRGKHIQVGLMTGGHKDLEISMDKIVANELEILGSHGMQAHKYPEMLAMILDGQLNPGKLVQKTISLSEVTRELPKMNGFENSGILVIDSFNT